LLSRVGTKDILIITQKGINFFDTSPYYGITKSETVLGKALKGIPREKYILSTKVGRYGPKEFDFSAERVTKSVHEVRNLLLFATVSMLYFCLILFCCGSPSSVLVC